MEFSVMAVAAILKNLLPVFKNRAHPPKMLSIVLRSKCAKFGALIQRATIFFANKLD